MIWKDNTKAFPPDFLTSYVRGNFHLDKNQGFRVMVVCNDIKDAADTGLEELQKLWIKSSEKEKDVEKHDFVEEYKPELLVVDRSKITPWVVICCLPKATNAWTIKFLLNK